VSSTRSRPTTDDGFTLVELVMAIVVLFIAMAAATQIIVSMVAATISNRHVDLAMSVATQTMEHSIAYDCGGQLLDPAAVPNETDNTKLVATRTFYERLQKRCLVDTNSNSTTAVDPADKDSCDAAAAAPNDPFNGIAPNAAKFLPDFDQLQTNLGSRRFTVHKSAASFSTAADGSTAAAGTLPVCTTVRLTWKFVTSVGVNTVDDGSNNALRLQRDVHVQWFEPRQTRVRFRDLTQVSALPPDTKVAVNQGRISVAAGIGRSAKIKMLNSDPERFVTYAADDTTGLVIFPFLPDGQFEVSVGGSPAVVVVTLGSSALGRSVCVPSTGSPSKFLTAAACS
jgi:prepilin-type N-terminal cleavage/methylation domain-containing protein